ncbi:MAG TPA: PAS domain-containing protein [Aliidongia sp.]|uniref:PAS domain-containing protein n=1 Tax=Aliidongia sp. TaxID=1914230 RepID=UPI002DDDBB11|nr:PAS domain-containing protein [Aliidongia sp.]HEV2678210.1 PAS domain-containing protein [Aliidongia sp.]
MLATMIPTDAASEDRTLLGPERTLYSVSLPADEMPEDRLTSMHRKVLSYWRAKRGAFAAPRRSDIDPCDLGTALPHLVLWEIDGVPDYRCRLAGTNVCENLIGNMQGILLGDLPCPLLPETRREFDAARDDGLVTLAERTLNWLGRPLIYYRHLLLPLVDDVGHCHQLMSVLTFHKTAEN